MTDRQEEKMFCSVHVLCNNIFMHGTPYSELYSSDHAYGRVCEWTHERVCMRVYVKEFVCDEDIYMYVCSYMYCRRVYVYSCVCVFMFVYVAVCVSITV